MPADSLSALAGDLPSDRQSFARRAARAAVGLMRTRHWTLSVGTALFCCIALAVALAPLIAPYEPSAQKLLGRLASPSAAHWLGTDHLGRDELSRLLFGGRFSISIAAVTLLLSAAVGTVVGVVSARTGGILDEILMRTVDLLISFPDVIIAVFLVAILGPGYGTLIAALTVVGWTPFARLARGLALEINSKGYIEAAEVLGCTKAFIIFRHLIPNAARPLAAMGFLRFGHKLITVGGLSFLGLGVQPPDSDWAAMLGEAQNYLHRAPLLAIAPGLAIFLTALSVTWIGKGLETPAKRRRRTRGGRHGRRQSIRKDEEAQRP